MNEATKSDSESDDKLTQEVIKRLIGDVSDRSKVALSLVASLPLVAQFIYGEIRDDGRQQIQEYLPGMDGQVVYFTSSTLVLSGLGCAVYALLMAHRALVSMRLALAGVSAEPLADHIRRTSEHERVTLVAVVLTAAGLLAICAHFLDYEACELAAQVPAVALICWLAMRLFGKVEPSK